MGHAPRGQSGAATAVHDEYPSVSSSTPDVVAAIRAEHAGRTLGRCGAPISRNRSPHDPVAVLAAYDHGSGVDVSDATTSTSGRPQALESALHAARPRLSASRARRWRCPPAGSQELVQGVRRTASLDLIERPAGDSHMTEVDDPSWPNLSVIVVGARARTTAVHAGQRAVAASSGRRRGQTCCHTDLVLVAVAADGSGTTQVRSLRRRRTSGECPSGLESKQSGPTLAFPGHTPIRVLQCSRRMPLWVI